VSQEFTEDGMPIFIDTAGLPSAEQWRFACTQIAHLQESDKDNREWLRELHEKLEAHASYNREWNREIELRIDDLFEDLVSKKKWWQIWKT